VARNHNFGQILTLGAPVTTRSVYSVALCWQKNQFLPFFGLRHLVVSPIGSSLRKLNTGGQLQTFLQRNGIKIVSVGLLQRLRGEIGRINIDVQKRDEQTNKQTKNSTFLAAPAAGEIRAPPNLAW